MLIEMESTKTSPLNQLRQSVNRMRKKAHSWLETSISELNATALPNGRVLKLTRTARTLERGVIEWLVWETDSDTKRGLPECHNGDTLHFREIYYIERAHAEYNKVLKTHGISPLPFGKPTTALSLTPIEMESTKTSLLNQWRQQLGLAVKKST